jgi:hypothetical protein
MTMNRFALILAFVLWGPTVSACLWGQSPDAKPSFIPPAGVVPNQETAVRIAEALPSCPSGKIVPGTELAHPLETLTAYTLRMTLYSSST